MSPSSRSQEGPRLKIFRLSSISSFVACSALAAACNDGDAPQELNRAERALSHFQATDRYGRLMTRACPDEAPGGASCNLWELGPAAPGVFVPGDIQGGVTAWGANDLASAFDVPTTLPTSATVAVVSGSHNPNLESDLQVYRNAYGLPTCSTANGCLRIVNATGGTTFGGTNPADVAESATDVQMASGGCPNCKLLVVIESASATQAPLAYELATAAIEAQTLGGVDSND